MTQAKEAGRILVTPRYHLSLCGAVDCWSLWDTCQGWYILESCLRGPTAFRKQGKDGQHRKWQLFTVLFDRAGLRVQLGP